MDEEIVSNLVVATQHNFSKHCHIQFPYAQCDTTIPVRNPLLAVELADNGGATMTLALMDGSPAIDAGDPTVCTEQIGLVDQRGMPRSDGKCDIGAYEKQ